MTNTVSKGNRRELQARKLLEKADWMVEKKNRTRYQSPDFFGLFDLMAIYPPRTKFIQVKSSISHVSKAKKEILQWTEDNNLVFGYINFEVWLKPDRKPWRCWRLYNSGWKELPSDYILDIAP